MYMSTPSRAAVGFIGAALSVLTFHQGMWTALHLLDLPGLGMPAPFPTESVPPLGVPKIVSLCFWGGLYGVVFALLAPHLSPPLWRWGILLGLAAVLVGFFIVAPLKGAPIAAGWAGSAWARSLLINLCWGLGVGVILPLIAPGITRARRRNAFG